MRRKMQCMHCGAVLHLRAASCWRCGTFLTEGVEPPHEDDEHALTPSELILLSLLHDKRDYRNSQDLMLRTQVLSDHVITMVFSTALLACQRAGLLQIEVRNTSFRSDLLLTVTGKSSNWPLQTLEMRIVKAVPWNHRLKLVVQGILPDGESLNKRLHKLGLGELLERGLVDAIPVEAPMRVFGIQVPKQVFGIEMPWSKTFYRLTEAGRKLTRKHPPDVVLRKLDAEGQTGSRVVREVTSALSEMRDTRETD